MHRPALVSLVRITPSPAVRNEGPERRGDAQTYEAT